MRYSTEVAVLSYRFSDFAGECVQSAGLYPVSSIPATSYEIILRAPVEFNLYRGCTFSWYLGSNHP